MLCEFVGRLNFPSNFEDEGSIGPTAEKESLMICQVALEHLLAGQDVLQFRLRDPSRLEVLLCQGHLGLGDFAQHAGPPRGVAGVDFAQGVQDVLADLFARWRSGLNLAPKLVLA